MKLGNGIGLWPSIGLMIEDRQISLSVVATTPQGRKETVRETQPCEEGGQAAVLEQMLAPWTGPKMENGRKSSKGAKYANGPWVQIALPESRIYNAVVPITSANRSAAPQAFFMEATQATNMRAEERVIDLTKLELNKQPLACLAAGQRLWLTELIDTLTGLGTRVALIEAAPASLFRAGAIQKKTPRSSKLMVRFFLGRTQALGVLAAGAPLLWHTFDLSEDPSRAILGTYATLWMQGRHAGIKLPIDTVIVHGRPELNLGIQPEAFRERTGAKLLRHASPVFDPASAALGAALATPLVDTTGINLARGFRPPVPIREIFPWGELVVHGLLVAGVSMFLHGKAVELDTQLKTTEVELHTFSWLKDQTQAQLETEKQQLDDRLKALETCETSRVDWSAQLRALGAHIPESTLVSSFQGTGELGDNKGRNTNRNQMVVNFTTPLSEDGEMPPEINEFIAALRAEPVIKRHYPTMDVSGVQRQEARGNQKPTASYSVVCKP
ncbi:MAG: hypothetical protein ACP5XB_16915 [Isosphaeraceae bacterium]